MDKTKVMRDGPRKPVITKEQFFAWTESCGDVEIVACIEAAEPEDDQVILNLKRYNPPRGKQVSVHPTETLLHSIDEWNALAAMERDLEIMVHQTRIVGYYSQLQNWNRSKLAELYDRQRGTYGPPLVPGDPGYGEEAQQAEGEEASE